MPIQKGLRVKNLKFFTGVENYEENNAVPFDKFYFAQNIRFDAKVASSKNGFQKLASALVGGVKFRGFFSYKYFDGTSITDKLIGLYNKTFYEFDSGTTTFTPIATTWPNLEDKDVDAVSAGNALYVVGQTGRKGNGVGKVFSGIDYTFTVSGVTITPTVNAVYQESGSQYVIISTNIVAGAGTIVAKKQIATTDPAALTGSISLLGGGTGDATINFTNWSKAAAVTTTFTVIDNSPEGTGIEYFAERLCIIGDPSFFGQIIHGQPTTSANEVYKIENFDTTKGAAYFSAAKNSPLVAIQAQNNILYYSGLDTLYQHSPDVIAAASNPVELARTAGALNNKSFTCVENDIWFINKYLEIRSLGQERNMGDNPRTKSVSEVIKRYIPYLDTNQDNPVMSYYNRVIKLHLKTKDSPTNNFTIIFDYNTGGFSTDRGQSVTCACEWNGKLVYAEDNTGNTFYDDTGYSANGANITSYAYTPFDDDNRPDIFKRARYVYFRGKQSYTQEITLYLFRDGDYTKYTTYTIPSPQARGVTAGAVTNDGSFGSSEFGDSKWGGDAGSFTPGIGMYEVEELISVSQRSNLFALGFEANCNGGKIVCEQMILKVIDEPESYKRSNI